MINRLIPGCSPCCWRCLQLLPVPDQSNERNAAENSSLLETAGLGLCKRVFLITNSQRAELPAYKSIGEWKIAMRGLMGLLQLPHRRRST